MRGRLKNSNLKTNYSQEFKIKKEQFSPFDIKNIQKDHKEEMSLTKKVKRCGKSSSQIIFALT